MVHVSFRLLLIFLYSAQLSSYTLASSINGTFEAELGKLLSPNAAIFFPDDISEWGTLTARWSTYHGPSPAVVVKVATTKDIQVTIQYCRQRKISVLATNRGHGNPSTLGRFQGGVEINVSGLSKISVDKTKNVATIGGGVRNYDLIQALYAAQKQSQTGSCSCPGFLGIGLGGGHGRQQGLYGLVADNILTAAVVLANGKVVQASETENSDLFWALRGAGQNYGIVSEITYKIYDLVDNGAWWYANYIYANTSAQAIFELMNDISPIQPEKLSFGIQYVWLAANESYPAISVVLNYMGTTETQDEWTSRFNALSPIVADIGTVQWNELAESSFNGLNSTLCADGSRRNQYPVGLKSYDVETVISVLEVFGDMGAKNPGLRGSIMEFEGYPLQAFQAIPAPSTAYPHRSTNIISLFLGTYTDASLDPIANTYGKQIRSLLQKTSGFTDIQAYVNYAQGDETLEQVYGDEEWRIRKLRAVKRAYDPHNVFGFYEPIPS